MTHDEYLESLPEERKQKIQERVKDLIKEEKDNKEDKWEAYLDEITW